MTSLTRLAKTSIILNWLVVGLACSSTIVHLIWLLRIRKSRPRVADICVWLALFFGIVLVAQTTWAIVDEGSARHQWDVSQQNIAAIAKSLIINEMLWSICGALIRISGCCILRELFVVFSNFFQVTTALICLCIAHGIASVLEVCLICRPVTKQWDPNARGLCGNQTASYMALEVSGLVLDLAILLTPLPPLISSSIKTARKLSVIVVLDAAALLLVVTALRLKALHLAASTDYTYSKSYLGLLSSVGCMLGVVLCNAVALPAILKIVRIWSRSTVAVHNTTLENGVRLQIEFTGAINVHGDEDDVGDEMWISTHETHPFRSLDYDV